MRKGAGKERRNLRIKEEGPERTRRRKKNIPSSKKEKLQGLNPPIYVTIHKRRRLYGRLEIRDATLAGKRTEIKKKQH